MTRWIATIAVLVITVVVVAWVIGTTLRVAGTPEYLVTLTLMIVGIPLGIAAAYHLLDKP